MNSYYHHSLLFVIVGIASIIMLSSFVISTVIAQNNSSSTSRDHSYYTGPIADPNDPTHVKAQQQSAKDRWVSSVCDKGYGNPSCYNVGYYSGVAEAVFENTDYNNRTRVIILYSPVCPSPNTANFCAGDIQGYSHTYTGHITNTSEGWNAGYNIGYTNGGNMDFNSITPLNGTNPASCTERPAAFCDGYSQGYPHGIEVALGTMTPSFM